MADEKQMMDAPPQNLGVERDLNRNTSETSEDRDREQAIKPYAHLLESHLTREALPAIAAQRGECPGGSRVDREIKDYEVEAVMQRIAVNGFPDAIAIDRIALLNHHEINIASSETAPAPEAIIGALGDSFVCASTWIMGIVRLSTFLQEHEFHAAGKISGAH
jgi:hypothetical protein